ncbi:MAG TPA: phospholipid carrier-dependent glycosyltransferase [Streptosporangiaceae bacterium]
MLLAIATVLRVVTALGYRGAFWFSDSFDYVDTARRLYPHEVRPDGYAFWLLVLRPFGSFTVVTASQHLMGLAMGVLVYAVACRRGVRRWVAALAAVPVLFDAYEIQLEHIVLSDTWFMFLVVLAVAVLLWPGRPPSARRAAVVGLLLALATLTRSVGLPLLVVFGAYLVVRRVGWRPLVAVVAACALPLAVYAVWFHSWRGSYALSGSDGAFMYGRATTFADCAAMPPRLRPMCPREPVGARPAPQHYIWDPGAPLNRAYPDKFAHQANAAEREFAVRAIAASPGAYARTVALDTLRAFAPGRPVYPDRATYELYTFPEHVTQDWARTRGPAAASTARYGGGITTHVVEPYAGFMRAYQRAVTLPGPVLAIIVAAGAVLIVVRRRSSGRAAALPWCLGAALLVAPAATAQFDYRYVLPAVPLVCLALALATRPAPTETPVRGSYRTSRGPHRSESVTS